MVLAVGIDFGNNNTYISIAKTEAQTGALKADVIASETGDRFVPSYVSYYNSRSHPTAGLDAKHNLIRHGGAIVQSAKKILGLTDLDKANDVSEIQLEATIDNVLAYKLPSIVCEDNDDDDEQSLSAEAQAKIDAENAIRITPTAACAAVLARAKHQAEAYAGEPISACTVSVPASFTSAQSDELLAACNQAGLTNADLIHEPVAAVLAHTHDGEAFVTPTTKVSSSTNLVVGIGASGTDVSLVCVDGGLLRLCGSRQTTEVSGPSFIRKLMMICAGHFYAKNRMNVTESKKAVAKLRTECERILQNLSSAAHSTASIESLMEGIDLHFTIERQAFEAQIADIVASFRAFLEKSSKDLLAESKLASIDQVILVGGPLKIPLIQQTVRNLLPTAFPTTQPPPRLLVAPACDETVANGAALQSAFVLNYNTAAFDRRAHDACHFTTIPKAVGLETVGENGAKGFHQIIAADSPCPLFNSVAFTTLPSADKAAHLRIVQCDGHLLAEILVHPSVTEDGKAQLDVLLLVDKTGKLTVHVRDLLADSALLFSHTM